jgi:hypothetical protein
MNLAHKVIVFSFNYPHNFIHSVWKGTTATHLQNKFIDCYDKHGTEAVFNTFYLHLDAGNQTMLLNWIDANYNG